jgi:hypothetical protein
MNPLHRNPRSISRAQYILWALWAAVCLYALIWGHRGIFVGCLVSTAIGATFAGPLARWWLVKPTTGRGILTLALGLLVATVIGILVLFLRYLVGIRDD